MTRKTDGAEAPWWQPSLILFYRLSGWIAVPVVVAVFLGRYLDRKYGTEPWLFLATVGAAFVISSIGIVRDSVRELKRITDKESKGKKN